jgi:hypothetical protein
VKVIDENESTEVFKYYKKEKWINEMANDINNVNGNANALNKTEPSIFFNIKFKKADIHLLEEYLLITKNDKSINAYYYILLDKKTEPALIDKIDGEFQFKPGINPRKENTFKSYKKSSKAIKLEHNKVQVQLYQYLCGLYGKESVGTENPTGYGARVDIVVKNKNKIIFYELKTGYNLLSNIRDALTQLLEYCYYPDKKNASELVIVSLLPTNNKIERYLKNIRDKFGIPLFYKQFDKTIGVLI